MLKHRVLTALVLVSIVLGVVFFLPFQAFQAFIAVVVAIAAWEWSQFATHCNKIGRLIYSAVTVLLLYTLSSMPQTMLTIILGFSVGWWLIALVLICLYPKYTSFWSNSFVVLLMGFFVLYPCWLAIIFLRGLPNFEFYFLMLLMLVASADIGAYFSGRQFGKNKLAPQLSPGKTWEGVWGGMLACSITIFGASIIHSLFEFNFIEVICLFGCAIILSAFSVIGDLQESMLKRIAGIKDSGNILPGHGGILDRVDSVLAVAPLYAFLLLIFGDKL